MGARSAGKITDAELKAIENVACPGAGACGGQFTANTMAMALEFIGLTPMGLGNVPATDPRKDDAAYRSGVMVMDLLRKGVTPKQIVTRKAFENAIASVVATGGSTNAVLHLLAMAKEAGIELHLEEFDAISERTPLIADMKPWGRFTAVDLYKAGGTALLAKRLLDAGLLHKGQITASLKTLDEEAESAHEQAGQEVIRSVADPIKKTGGLIILKGNLTPEGCVLKASGHEKPYHKGPARVFDREEDAMENWCFHEGPNQKGRVWSSFANEGPRWRTCGMREMSRSGTAALVGIAARSWLKTSHCSPMADSAVWRRPRGICDEQAMRGPWKAARGGPRSPSLPLRARHDRLRSRRIPGNCRSN